MLLSDGGCMYMVDANIINYFVVLYILKKLFTSLFLQSYGRLSSRLCVKR